jgi:hypothetical protein
MPGFNFAIIWGGISGLICRTFSQPESDGNRHMGQRIILAHLSRSQTEVVPASAAICPARRKVKRRWALNQTLKRLANCNEVDKSVLS